MGTAKKYLLAALLLLAFLSAAMALFSVCRANCLVYQLLREDLKNPFFVAEEGE